MMDLSLASLLAEARYSLVNPRAGARRVMMLDLPMSARWLALGLMAVGSAILTHLSFGLIPPEDRDLLMGMMQSPIRTALLQAVLLVVTVYLICWIGRARGGKGSLEDTIVVMAWLQFLMLCIQMVQLLLQLVLPPLAALVNLAGFGIFLWLLTNFVAELHGFRSLPSVFGGLVLGLVLLALVIAAMLMTVAGGPLP